MERGRRHNDFEQKSSVYLREFLTGSSRKMFENALHKSEGKAVFLVHPFFPEQQPKLIDGTKYNAYLQSLKTSVEATIQARVPLVILEEEEKRKALPGRLNETGIQKGEAFVIPTQRSSPEPLYGTLTILSEQFAKQGVKEATVLGSILWRNPEGSALYNGCAGRTIEIFTKAGIKTKPGLAVYPPLG